MYNEYISKKLKKKIIEMCDIIKIINYNIILLIYFK